MLQYMMRHALAWQKDMCRLVKENSREVVQWHLQWRYQAWYVDLWGVVDDGECKGDTRVGANSIGSCTYQLLLDSNQQITNARKLTYITVHTF